MASPKILVQILVSGTRILGKAFFEAGRQAVKNAKHAPQSAMGGDVAGVGHANSGSISDQLTRQHRMTLDEAHLILNIKRGDAMEQLTKSYEHLFKANSPAPKPEKPVSAKLTPPSHSHYLQSKVVRARERIEAELKIPETLTTEAPTTGTSAPGTPPPSKGKS
ncbi:Pam16-domain-containing protein [Collybia nuda]|uniref:Mitochondrial import inner membrane translocase subunit TIM16 n=1 Tax=Collybia nuda TaxID=64659 RepID=A0A9P5Y2X9_9AGAR|nr:Pam16-domain-containing protein [Collybia nuda]